MKKIIFASLVALAILSGAALTADASSGHKTSKHQQQKNSAHRNDKTRTGTVDSVSSNSFVLKTKHKSYTVNIGSKTHLTNKDSNNFSLGDIKNGDRVKVSGKLSGTTLDAHSVKDLSR